MSERSADQQSDENVTPSGEGDASLAQVEPVPPERGQKSRSVYHSYHRWLRLSRLALALFLLQAAAIAFWLLPWIPSGVDPADYRPAASFTVYLLSAISLTGIVTLALRERAWRKRETLVAWSAVYDEATGLHHRTYLYDRLSLECDRAKRTGSAFSVLVLHVRLGSQRKRRTPTISNSSLQQIAELISRLSHDGDLVALLSNSELAIVAMQVERANRKQLLERLHSAVVAELPRLLSGDTIVGVAGGVATYGIEGRDPESLIKAARTATALGSPIRTTAA